MNANKEKVVVVGAGLMGTGIAHAFASAGFNTLLVDTNAASLTSARTSIEKILADGVRLGKVSEEQAQQSLANLLTCSDLSEAAMGANWLAEERDEEIGRAHV